MLNIKRAIYLTCAALVSIISLPVWAQGGGSVVVGSVNASSLPASSTLTLIILALLLSTAAHRALNRNKTLVVPIALVAVGVTFLLQPKLYAAVSDLFVVSTSPACRGGSDTIHYASDAPHTLTNQCSTTIAIKSYSLPCPSEIWQGSANAGTLLAANESIQLLSCGDFPPSFTLGAPISVDEDAGPQTFDVWITDISPGDPSEAGQTVSFTAIADNPALFSGQPAIDTNGTLTFTGVNNAHGTTNIAVTATDSAGSTSNQTFVLTITSVNDMPSFALSTNSLSILEDNGQDLNIEKTGPDFDSPPGGTNFTQVSIPGVVSSYDDADDDQTHTFNVTLISGTRSDANRNLSINASDIFYNGEIGINASGALEFKLNPHHWGELDFAITLSDSEGLTTAAQNLSLSIAPVWDNEPGGENLDITGNENSACVPISLSGESYRGLSQPVFIMTNFTLDGGKSGTLSQDGNPVTPPFTTTNPDFCFVPGTNEYSDFDFTFGTFDDFATFTYRVWSGLGDVDTGQSPSVSGHSDVFNELSPEYPSTITILPVFK